MEDYRPFADATNDIRQQCQNCRCWLRETDEKQKTLGACRVNSPHVAAVNYAAQPQTMEHAWCAEWVAR